MALVDLIGLNKAPIEDINVGENIKSGLQAGIGLATAKEQVDATKMKVAEQKLDLKTKQSTALMNRMTMALFAPNSKIGNSAVDSTQSWADQSKIPFNGEGVKQIISDPNLKLIAQKNMMKLRSGGVLNEKQMDELLSFAYSETPEMANILLNYNAENAKTKGDQEFQMQKQAAQIQGQKDVARIGLERVDATEDKQIAKEKRAEAKQLDNDFASTDKLLNDLVAIKTDMENYSKDQRAGTGPIATAGGLSKYFSQKTEGLDTKFNTVSLDTLTKTFAGMSKLADTGGERASFQSTQPSITKDDKTNLEILTKMIANAESMKVKILNAKKGIGAIEANELALDAKDEEFIKNVIKKGGTKTQALNHLKQKKAQAGR